MKPQQKGGTWRCKEKEAVNIQGKGKIRIARVNCCVRGYFCRGATVFLFIRSSGIIGMLQNVYIDHRGFLFVDYAYKHEAVSAIKAHSSIHFHGRNLVIELADKNGTLSDGTVRVKNARKVSRRWGLLLGCVLKQEGK